MLILPLGGKLMSGHECTSVVNPPLDRMELTEQEGSGIQFHSAVLNKGKECGELCVHQLFGTVQDILHRIKAFMIDQAVSISLEDVEEIGGGANMESSEPF
jgi:hypothetical protein